MSYTYATHKRPETAAPKTEQAPAQPSPDALRAGTAKPTSEQMGHRVDLPDAMRAKMEEAFGADLSAVKLYESEAVADAGANAIAQGSSIAFAPGMLDFTSFGGQALLGHELSHVVSQARGEVTGGGFLNDCSLEARADREGALAAAGRQIAAPVAAMSSVSVSPAAGPMQADKAENKINKHRDTQADQIAAMARIRRDGGDYLSNKEYIQANQKLAKAQKWEKYWADKQERKARENETEPPETTSVGMRVLDRLREQNTVTGEGGKTSFNDIGYLQEAESAMKIMKEGDEVNLTDRQLEDIASNREVFSRFSGDMEDFLTGQYRDKLIEENRANMGRYASDRRKIEVGDDMLGRLQDEAGGFIRGYQDTQLAGYDRIAEQGDDRMTRFDMHRARTRENQMRTILKRHDLNAPLSTPTRLRDRLVERYTGEDGKLDQRGFDRRMAGAHDITPDVFDEDEDMAGAYQRSMMRAHRRGDWNPHP